MQTELEYHEAKMKEYGWVQVPSLPVDAATQLKRDRRRAIAGMNAYRESLPEEVEGDYVATVDWEAEIAKAREEDFKKVLGIGEWFHDVPCEVKDCRKEGLTEAFYFLGACPRIRSWRRNTPRNNLLTAIWT